MEIYEKIETAICAALAGFVDGDASQQSSYWPASLKDADGNPRIFSGESDMPKDGQAVLVIAEDANQEEPQFTGNFMVPVQIWLRTPVKVLSADEIKKQMPTALQNHSAAAGILSDFFNQDAYDLVSQINAAGSDFTIMGGVMDLKPMRSEQPNFFGSGWSFRVYAMGKSAP